MKLNALHIWPCGHKTSTSYSNWPVCPVCALENSKFLETLKKMEDLEYYTNKQNLKEALADSKLFNNKI